MPYFEADPNKATSGTLIRSSAYNGTLEVIEQAFDDAEAVDEALSTRILAVEDLSDEFDTIRDEAANFAFNGNQNLIINSNFDIAQQRDAGIYAGGAMSNGTKPFDMWRFTTDTNDSVTAVRNAHTPGQTDVPGNPRRHARLNMTAGTTGAGNSLRTHIADVRSTSGTPCFHKIWGKSNTPVTIGFQVTQVFGTGGAPSAFVNVVNTTMGFTTAWQRFTHSWDMPSVAFKTIGTNENSHILIAYLLPVHVTCFVDFSSVGFVRGDIDPGDQWRDPEQDLRRVRYHTRVYATLPNANDLQYEMRALPVITGSGPYVADAEVV